jgi:cytochrome c-type biogenesis protein CcmH/NrfG
MGHLQSCGREIRTWMVVTALLAATAPLTAQTQSGCLLRGELVAGDRVSYGDLAVELEGTAANSARSRVFPSAGGQFEARNLTPGQYHLRVLDASGRIVKEDLVDVTGCVATVTVRLPEAEGKRSGSATVSLAQLRHKIPSSARKELYKAQKSRQAGDIPGAVSHLKKAIEIEPRYMEAHNNLGVRYIELGQYAAATAELRKAIELDPNAALAFANLSLSLFATGRSPEAETAARAAVRLDGRNRKARLLFGLILNAQKHCDREALENLRLVEKDFPRARLAAAEILARQGESHKAAVELRKYLHSDKVTGRARLEGWLAQLDRDSTEPVQSAKR